MVARAGRSRTGVGAWSPVVWHKSITAFADLGIYRLLLAQRESPELGHFYRDTLGPLLDHGSSSSDLIDTLEGYFLARGNVSRAATLLHVHRNTLIYRLQRISEIAGIDWERAEDQLALQIALKVHRVLRMSEMRTAAKGQAPCVSFDELFDPTLFLSEAGVLVEALEQHPFPPGRQKRPRICRKCLCRMVPAAVAVQFVHEVGVRFHDLQMFRLSYFHRAPGKDLFEEYLAVPYDRLQFVATPIEPSTLSANQRRVITELLSKSDAVAWNASEPFRSALA